MLIRVGLLVFASSALIVTSVVYTRSTVFAPGASSQASMGYGSIGAASAATVTSGNVSHGKTVYGANCASCHGATGAEGGLGPSLKHEAARKNAAAAIAWIENPKSPMPKLYPSPLSAKDVADVAAYIEKL